jgi:hypothetical protein
LVILTCINSTHEYIIHYYGMWYGSHNGRLGHMFANLRHILDDMESNNDGEDEHFKSDDGIMKFDGSRPWSIVISLCIIGSSETINSSTLMERVLAQLVTTMQEITNECKDGNVTLCEHATSHTKILAWNNHNIASERWMH